MNSAVEFRDNISIVLCGEAGQGIQTVEILLTRFLKRFGYNFFSTKEYMSRIRGGSNSTEIRISSQRVSAYVDRIDLLIPLSREALTHLKPRISPETCIIGDPEKLTGTNGNNEYSFIEIPFSRLAEEVGGTLYANIIAVGVLSALLELDRSLIDENLVRFFSRKDPAIVEKNRSALVKGYDIGLGLSRAGTLRIAIDRDPDIESDIVINGAEAVGLGALAGGCSVITSYPMSPSTGVLTFLSQRTKEFDIIAEQAEDEISAINMALGASYAGARSMVTTSGGGFALMEEGVSLAGMLETPVVIHLAQRPGPATGLPTRTQQGDLEMALYSGHGDFPRIIFAPGTLDDAFCLTQQAFNFADEYQSPVFILTDQYLIDSYYNTPMPDLSGMRIDSHIVKTDADYQRYVFTRDGISPRGIPGFGDGLVVVDSDEHDEWGHITEDLKLRVSMVDKRLKKREAMMKTCIPPELIGDENAPVRIVCWGSPFPVIREAVGKCGDGFAILYFRQLYPLHHDTADMLTKAEHLAIIEGNATSQFGRLLKLETGIDIGRKLLKYNGLQFSVEEVCGFLESLR